MPRFWLCDVIIIISILSAGKNWLLYSYECLQTKIWTKAMRLWRDILQPSISEYSMSSSRKAIPLHVKRWLHLWIVSISCRTFRVRATLTFSNFSGLIWLVKAFISIAVQREDNIIFFYFPQRKMPCISLWKLCPMARWPTSSATFPCPAMSCAIINGLLGSKMRTWRLDWLCRMWPKVFGES